jgi:hypothetical protein
MNNKIELVSSYVMGGSIGWKDTSNSTYTVHGKLSNWATPEQNGKLELALYAAYRAYLLDVASTNDGNY